MRHHLRLNSKGVEGQQRTGNNKSTAPYQIRPRAEVLMGRFNNNKLVFF